MVDVDTAGNGLYNGAHIQSQPWGHWEHWRHWGHWAGEWRIGGYLGLPRKTVFQNHQQTNVLQKLLTMYTKSNCHPVLKVFMNTFKLLNGKPKLGVRMKENGSFQRKCDRANQQAYENEDELMMALEKSL